MSEPTKTNTTHAAAVRNFRPLRDLILVKPDVPPEKVGSIYITRGSWGPQGEAPGEHRDSFTGTVVAVGPGDRYTERLVKGQIVRKLIHPDGRPRRMHVKPGDRVVFPRRPSSPFGTDMGSGKCDVYIDGEGYLIFHEEQSCLAIINP